MKFSTSKAYNIVGAKLIYARTAGSLILNTSAPIDIFPLITNSGNNYSFDINSLFRDPFTTDPIIIAAKPLIFSDEGYYKYV